MSSTHIDLRALRHVVGLAKTLNYTRAAQALNLTQSALTRSIQATEQRADLKLFDRDKGGVRLTAVGKVFVERAIQLLQDADDFSQQVQRMAGGEDYEVHFGMAPLPAKTLLPELAVGTIADSSRLRWQVEIKSAQELLPLLLQEKLEFFLCAEEQFPNNTPVKMQPLGRFPLSFSVRRGHPLLSGEVNVGPFPVVSVAPIPSYQSFPAALTSQLEFPPKLVVNDYALLATITRQTDAVWPTSSLAVLDELRQGSLVPLTFSDKTLPVVFDIVIVSLQKRTLSPAAMQLQNYFREAIKKLERLLPALPR
ncbi:LysR family transcriptional regulator [Halioxenophilus sp. WMMB6]|uniref:LysR family transcriptional regulator n=1 Tax=Halioxenophilus sp. WMMB6 TaxID=3073815 RepID=UPI00295F4302|nr:LysR family transcriptional regulator [Halioxenophilus sp. WMMB6]